MKYCCTVTEKEGTCYHEFKKGEYKGEHWSEDSLLLEDDLLDELKLYDLFLEVISDYDRWYITNLDRPTWYNVLQKARQVGGETEVVINEINDWAQEAFKTEEVFTILGV